MKPDELTPGREVWLFDGSRPVRVIIREIVRGGPGVRVEFKHPFIYKDRVTIPSYLYATSEDCAVAMDEHAHALLDEAHCMSLDEDYRL